MAVPKAWKDGKAGGTPLSAAAMIDAEERQKTETQAEVAVEKGRAEAAEAGKATPAEVSAEEERAKTVEASKASTSEIAEVKPSGAGSNSDTTVDSSKEVNRKVAVETTRAKAAEISVVELGADVSLTKESTALQDVTGLAVPISASATERKRAFFFLEVEGANAVEDIEIGFSVPAGCTMRWGALGPNTANVAGYGATTTGSTPISLRDAAGGTAVISFGTSGGKIGIALIARIIGGGTAGNVQLRAAQDVSDAGALKVLKGSWIETLLLAA